MTTTPTNTRSQGGVETLLPCPFCGGVDVRLARHPGAGVGMLHHGDDIYSIDCMGCGATFPNRYRPALLRDAWNKRALAAPASAQEAAQQRVYLVATGEIYEGQETYTRHDVRPPLCDAEVLYSAPSAAVQQGEALTAPSDGDYLRQARHGGASVVWQGEDAGVHFSTAAWAAFCNSLRTTDRAALASAQPKTGESNV